MRNRAILTAFVVALLLLPAWAAKVSVEFDESVNFDRYLTYALRQGTFARRIEVQGRIESFVKRELNMRGLAQVEESPDLIVRTYSLVDELTLEQLSDETTWQFYTGLTDMDAYAVGAGTLVVDVSEAGDAKVLWRGLITAPVNGNTRAVERKLDKAVAKLFRSFPR